MLPISEDRIISEEGPEWLAGRYAFPDWLQPGEATAAAVILWMELPEKTMVTVTPVTAERSVSFAESFERGRQEPVHGEPRSPSRIRVADEQFVNELREVAGDIPITVAPVPELDAAFEELLIALTPVDRPDYDDDDLPHLAAPPVPTVGRNDPCPCGSGKKYKKCHLDRDQGPRRAYAEATSIRLMNARLCEEIRMFGRERFPADWPDLSDCSEGADTLVPLWQPWTITIGGTHVASRFFEERWRRLSAEQREWFAAQQRTWLSVWRVTTGEGRLELTDLLTGQHRTVYEELLAALVPGDRALLGRIIDFRGASHFGGLYAGDLSLTAASNVITLIRSDLNLPDGPLTGEQLRDDRVGRALLEAWETAFEAERAERTA